jgi:hypothetical protein
MIMVKHGNQMDGRENIQIGLPATGLKLVGSAWANPKSMPPIIIIINYNNTACFTFHIQREFKENMGDRTTIGLGSSLQKPSFKKIFIENK